MSSEINNIAAYEQKIRDVLVIDETSPTGIRWNFRAAKKVRGKAAGSMTDHGYIQVGIVLNEKYRGFRAHRIVWFLAYREWPKKEIDHINGDKTDNRISNLRQALGSENTWNTKRRKNSTSGVKGVCFDKNEGKWKARIGLAGKRIQIGLFTDISEAEKAIRSARERLHGSFANHGE